MKSYFLYIIFILFSSSHCYAQHRDFGPAGTKGLSPEQLDNLHKGQIIFLTADSGNAGGKNLTEAAIVFSATPQTTWNLISKTEDQPKYIDGCIEIKVTRTSPGKAYEVHKVGKMLVSYNYGVIQNYVPENKCLYWSLDSGYPKNDLNSLSGYWQFYAFGKGKTLGRYGSHISLKNIPEFIEKTQLKSGIKDALVDVKKYVDSGGTYRK